MAVTIKLLGFGQLTSTTVADLYSAVGTNKAQIVKNMRFTNTSATANVTLNVYLNEGSDVQISPKDMVLGPGATYVDDNDLTLEATLKLRGKVSSGGTVDWAVSGVERDA